MACGFEDSTQTNAQADVATNAQDVTENTRLLGRINFTVETRCDRKLPIARISDTTTDDGLHRVLLDAVETVASVWSLNPRSSHVVRFNFSIGLTRQTIACLFDDFIKITQPSIDGYKASITFSPRSEHLKDYVWELTHKLARVEVVAGLKYSMEEYRIEDFDFIRYANNVNLEVYNDALLAGLIHDEIRIASNKDKIGKQKQLAEAYHEMCEATKVVDTSMSDLALGAALWDRNLAVRKYERVCVSCVDTSAINTITFLGKTLHV